MALSKDEIQQALNSHPQLGSEEISRALQGAPQAQIQPQLSLMDQLKGAGLGFLQAGTESGRALNQLMTASLNKIFGTHLQSPEASMFALTPKLATTTGSKVGEALGDIASAAIPGAGIGRLAEGASLLPRILSYGGAAAATTPGGAVPRAMAGGLGALGGLGDWLASGGSKYFSNKSLGKAVEQTFNEQKGVGNRLYDKAFDGTDAFTPNLSNNTNKTLDDLLKRPAGNRAIKQSIDRYEEKPTLENLHTLKSDFGKFKNKLDMKRELDSVQEDTRGILGDAINNIEKDLDKNMEGVGPGKYQEYKVAQSHWKNNVVPFKTFKSIRDLLGPENKISPLLRRHLLENSESANKLRGLLNLSETGLRAGAQIPKMALRALTYGVPVGVGGYEIGKALRSGLGE